MKKTTSYYSWLLVIYLICLPFKINAQRAANNAQQTTNNLYDTLQISQQYSSAAVISELKKDKALHYSEDKTPPENNFLLKFFQWFFNLFSFLFVKIIFYLLLLGGLVYLIWRIVNKRGWKIFSNDIPADESENNNHEYAQPDINNLIQQAIAQDNYRLAIRWLYIQNIQLLFAKNMIAFNANKTNHDYLQELFSSAFYNDFKLLTRYYEYCWLGNFELDKNNFSSLQDAFLQFRKKINKSEESN